MIRVHLKAQFEVRSVSKAWKSLGKADGTAGVIVGWLVLLMNLRKKLFLTLGAPNAGAVERRLIVIVQALILFQIF